MQIKGYIDVDQFGSPLKSYNLEDHEMDYGFKIDC